MSSSNSELSDEVTPLLADARSNETPPVEETPSNEADERTTTNRFFGNNFSCAMFFKGSRPARFSHPRVFCFVLMMLLPYTLVLSAVATTGWHRVADSNPPLHSGLFSNCTGTVCLPFDQAILGYELGACMMISALVSVLLLPIKSFTRPAWPWHTFLTVWILLWFVLSMTGSLLAVVASPYDTSGVTGNSSFMAITGSGVSLLIWLAKMYVSCDSD